MIDAFSLYTCQITLSISVHRNLIHDSINPVTSAIHNL